MLTQSNLVGSSVAISNVYQTVQKIAATDSTVLITGESGTGKELVAKAIHELSNRANMPMVTVNCGAIPADLLEAELFGHVKGAFTGATQTRMGRFELAQGGTIFLDEVGELPLSLQVKLLRVLQQRQFEQVGSSRTQDCDVRIIAATNRDLEAAVKNKEFREDLYYRLNVIPLRVPALRERKTDVPNLIQHFLSKFNQATGNQVVIAAGEVMDALMQYNWPGNVRELENLMERLVILKGQGQIELGDLPHRIFQTSSDDVSSSNAGTINEGLVDFPRMPLPQQGLDLKAVVSAFENHLIDQALARTGNNKNKASELLMMNRTTLVEKLRKRGMITPAPKRQAMGISPEGTA